MTDFENQINQLNSPFRVLRAVQVQKLYINTVICTQSRKTSFVLYDLQCEFESCASAQIVYKCIYLIFLDENKQLIFSENIWNSRDTRPYISRLIYASAVKPIFISILNE